MMDKKLSVLALLDSLQETMEMLVDVFEDNAEGINLNESDSVAEYPFSESLDETLLKVIAWKEAVVDDLEK